MPMLQRPDVRTTDRSDVGTMPSTLVPGVRLAEMGQAVVRPMVDRHRWHGFVLILRRL